MGWESCCVGESKLLWMCSGGVYDNTWQINSSEIFNSKMREGNLTIPCKTKKQNTGFLQHLTEKQHKSTTLRHCAMHPSRLRHCKFNSSQQWVSYNFIETFAYTKAKHVINIQCFGREQGWPCGGSTRLPPMWPRLDSRTWHHMWVEFVVGSRPCSEGFSPVTPVILPPQKPTFSNSNLTWNARIPLNELLELFGALWVNKLH